MKSNHRYYAIGALCLTIILVCGGYYAALTMLWKKGSSVASYKQELLSGEQRKKVSETMIASFEKSKNDISLVQSFFVNKQGEVDFIEFIEKVAQEEDLEIKMDVSIDSPTDLAAYNMEYLVLKVQVRGAWSRVWNFSRMLEVLPYSVNVKSFALVGEKKTEVGSGARGLWTGVYTLNVLKHK